MSGASGSLGTSVKSATVTKQFANDFDNTAGASALVLNKASLLALSGAGSAGIYSYDISIISSPASVEFKQGATAKIMMRQGDSESRAGADNDDNTLSHADEFTLTLPIGAVARIRWVEIV